MSDKAICVQNLGKRYRIGALLGSETRQKAGGFKFVTAPVRYLIDTLRQPSEDEILWALRDVSFEMSYGQTLGVIGKNGAGKSTLLKILSKITEPTTGRAVINGRIASMLEVGTGFHPDLTGRENIYINGAIMGMLRQEIDRKLDAIVEFSGVEKFLDTPVKYYSSGMFVRLAFSVAAHLEPEILIVDEVLAVGDGEFQRKCLSKMDETMRQGRTIIFVSHNMWMIESLCSRTIILENGQIVADGATENIISQYINQDNKTSYMLDYSNQTQPVGDEMATLQSAYIGTINGEPKGEFDMRTPFKIVMRYKIDRDAPSPPLPNFHFVNSRGEYAFVAPMTCRGEAKAGIYEAECIVPGDLLNSDIYSVGLALTFTHMGKHISFFEKNALAVRISEPVDETQLLEVRHGYVGPVPGIVRPQLEWEHRKLS